MMDATINNEDLTIKILEGLNVEYKDISSAVRAHETPISFENFHEKLLILKPTFSMKKRRKIIYQLLQMLLTKWEMVAKTTT